MVSLTERQYDILTGLLMGDAYRTSGSIGVEMVEEDFLKWLKSEFPNCLGPISTRKRGENRKQTYRIRFKNFNERDEFLNWYGDDGKAFPQNIELNPLISKVWYCCDGSLIENPCSVYVTFSINNEVKRLKKITDMFSQIGYSVTEYKYDYYHKNLEREVTNCSVRIPKEESERFLDWMGEPLPGFGYKWNYDLRESKYSKPTIKEEDLKRLREEQGLTYREIGEIFGESWSVARYWCDKFEIGKRKDGIKAYPALSW